MIFIWIGQSLLAQDTSETYNYAPSFWQKHIFNGKNTVEFRVLRPIGSSYYFDRKKVNFGLQNTIYLHNFKDGFLEYLELYSFEILGMNFWFLKNLLHSFSYNRELNKGFIYYEYSGVGARYDYKPVKDDIIRRGSVFHGVGYKHPVWAYNSWNTSAGLEATFRKGGEMRVKHAAINGAAYEYKFYTVYYKDFGISVPVELEYKFNSGLLLKYQMRYAYFMILNDIRAPRHFFGSGFWLGYRF